MSTTYADVFRADLEQCAPGLHDDPDGAPALNGAVARRALGCVVEAACTSQNMHRFSLARAFMRRLPSAWVARHIRYAIDDKLDVNDEWEFRRLLELLAGAEQRRVLVHFIKVGRESTNEEVKEAAEEFAQSYSVGLPSFTTIPAGRVELQIR